MRPSKAPVSAPGTAHGNVRSLTRKLSAKVLTYFSQNIDLMARGLTPRLADLIQSGSRSQESQIKHWKQGHALLDRNTKTFGTALLTALEKCLDEEVQRILSERDDAPGMRTSRDDIESLSLVETEEMDRMLVRDQLTQHFNARYGENLAALNQRLRVLFRRDVADLQGNPYRPQVLLRAFQLALENCSLEESAAHDVLQAIDPKRWIDLGPLYVELDHILSQTGIRAEAHRVRKASGDDGGVRSRAGPGTGDAPLSGFSGFAGVTGFSGFAPTGIPASMPGSMPASMPMGLYPSMPMGMHGGYVPAGWTTSSHAREFLHQLGMSAPMSAATTGMGMVGSPASEWHNTPFDPARGLVAAQPFLIDYLEALQNSVIASFGAPALDIDLGHQNILRTMREHEEIRGAQELDRGTVDALAEVFDFVFADSTIPSALKVIIGKLQIPVLKAAMLDRKFFLSSHHPARRLIDTLAASSVAWNPEKGSDDPLYVHIEAAVKRVLAEFEEDLALFGEVLLEFEEFLAEDQQRAQQEVDAVAAAQAADEALEAARAIADQELLRRVQALPDELGSTAFLLPFLTNQWREVLARAYVAQDTQPDEWTRLLETTDQLLWSTQHKRDSAERRRLIGVLPVLVRQLNASLDTLGWSGEERDAFTQRLIATHMNALRSTADPTLDAELVAEDQRMGEDAISMLDQRVAAAQDEQAEEWHEDDWDSVVQGLERGMWFDFISDEGHNLRYRLTWISPQRTRLLFTNRQGYDALVRSEREVCEWLRQGRLRILNQQSIVTRALDVIMAPAQAGNAA